MKTGKNNVSVYQVPDSKSTALLDGRKQDEEFVQKLCSDTLEIGCDDQDIESIYHIGKKREGSAP